MGHGLQVCPRTWGHRIKWHEALLEMFLHKMENRGWAVTRVLVITVQGGSLQIPDAVLYSFNTCEVVDASVVRTGLSRGYQEKSSSVPSYSTGGMFRAFGISINELVVFSALVCEWGWEVYRTFYETTA